MDRLATAANNMSLPAVATWDGGSDLRTNAASVGLQAIRVAAAAARLLGGNPLSDRDRLTLGTVSADLLQEAQVLRHELMPSVLDESAYAFAGVALSALSTGAHHSPSEEDAAQELEDLAKLLDQMQSQDPVPDTRSLTRIQDIFFRANELVRVALTRSGELIEGNEDTSTTFHKA